MNSKECENSRQCIMDAFTTLGLCDRCWRAFLNCENNPELEKKLHKWFHGEYADNSSAEKRLQNQLLKSTNEVKISNKEGEK